MNTSSIETINVSVDSRYRIYPDKNSSTDCTVKLPNIFSNVISARITSIEVPNISYTFGTDHTTVLQVRPGPDMDQTISADYHFDWETVRLPLANYTLDTLQSTLQHYIGKSLGFPQSMTLSEEDQGFVVNIDKYTGQVSMYINRDSSEIIGNDISSFDINLSPVDLNSVYTYGVNNGYFTGVNPGEYYLKELQLYQMAFKTYTQNLQPGTPILRDILGFSDFMYYALSDPINNPIGYNKVGYKSTGFIDIYGQRYLLLQVNDYDSIRHVVGNNIITAFSKISLDKKFRYPHKPDLDHEIDSVSPPIVFEQPVDIAQLKIRLLDPIGNVVNLLGQNFSFTMEITHVRDNKKYDMYRDTYVKPGKLTAPDSKPTRLRNVRFQ